MIHGREEGLCYQFDSTGALIEKDNYSKGKKNGLSFLYNSKGTIENENLYRNDSLLFNKQFYYNGVLKSYFIMKDNTRTCYYLMQDSMGIVIENSGDSNICKRW